MIKKVTFGRRAENGDVYFVSQYKLFGVLLYERSINSQILLKHEGAALAL